MRIDLNVIVLCSVVVPSGISSSYFLRLRLQMAGKIHALGVNPGHFSHIFLDEAGHAEEPLSLAATAGLITSSNKSVSPHSMYWLHQ